MKRRKQHPALFHALLHNKRLVRGKENHMRRMPILSETDMSLFELKTRYVRNYLTFAGKNSKDFLLYISGPGVYDNPEVDVELQSITGKNGDIIPVYRI